MTLTRGSKNEWWNAAPIKATSAGSKSKKTEAGTIATVETFMAEMFDANVQEVEETEVLKATGYTRTDSTGYRKAMKTLLKELKTVEKQRGIFTLTRAGLIKLRASDVIPPEPTTNAEAQAALAGKLHKMARAPTDKINAIWNLLADGRVHTSEEVLKEGGYKRHDSTGYKEIMKWLGKLELLDKSVGSRKDSCKLHKEKLFPFDE